MPDSECVRGVQARHGRDRVRQCARVGRADVDPREDQQRVLEPHAGQARRRRRERPVHEHREPRGDEERVAEDPEAVPRAVVEPEEEDPGEQEVARRSRRHSSPGRRPGSPRKTRCNELLPREAGHPLDVETTRARVRERLVPVRHHQHASALVGAERTPARPRAARSAVAPLANDCRRRVTVLIVRRVGSIAAMALVWLALAVSLVAVAVAATMTTRRGLDALPRLPSGSQRVTGEELESIERRTAADRSATSRPRSVPARLFGPPTQRLAAIARAA